MTTDFSDVPVEQWDIEKLIPYENNHKKHTEATVKARADSIAEFGLEHPIAIEDDGTIISGHGRRLSLLSLGRKFAPVRVFRGITKEQANKLRIAANKTTSTDYDTDILAKELHAILESGLTLDGLGLTEKETQTLMEDIGEIDLDTLSEDITLDIDRHDADISSAASKANEATVPIAKAFGVKTVSAEAARAITHFIGLAEEKTGKKDFDAVTAFMEATVNAAR